MKIRIFIWLMWDNKILTQQVLISRGCSVQTGCHLCQSVNMEIRDHMLWDCIFAQIFWIGLQAQHNISPQGGVSSCQRGSRQDRRSPWGKGCVGMWFGRWGHGRYGERRTEDSSPINIKRWQYWLTTLP